MNASVVLLLWSCRPEPAPTDRSTTVTTSTTTTSTTTTTTTTTTTGDTGTNGLGYLKLSAGQDMTCALTTAGDIRCAGSTRWQVPAASAGPYTDLAVGWDTVCGVGTDGTLACWGCDWVSGSCSPPPGARFATVDAADDFWCALDTDGLGVCWGSYGSGPVNGVVYSTFAVGVTGFVGVRASDGSVDAAPEAGQPAGPLAEIGASRSATCGIRAADGTTTCDGYFGPPIPDGLSQIDGYSGDFCWLDSAGHADCITNKPVAARDGFDPAVEVFTSLTTGHNHACAVTADGRGYCWPHDGRSETSGIAARPQ